MQVSNLGCQLMYMKSDASGRISHAQEMAKRGYAIHLSAAELAHWYEELEGECDAQKD